MSINKGQPIFHITLQYLEKVDVDAKTRDNVRKLLYDRYKFGLAKYGQPLMSEDGRDDIEEQIKSSIINVI